MKRLDRFPCTAHSSLFPITEMRVITPLVGANLYAVIGVAADVPLEIIFREALPLPASLIVCKIIFILFP